MLGSLVYIFRKDGAKKETKSTNVVTGGVGKNVVDILGKKTGTSITSHWTTRYVQGQRLIIDLTLPIEESGRLFLDTAFAHHIRCRDLDLDLEMVEEPLCLSFHDSLLRHLDHEMNIMIRMTFLIVLSRSLRNK